MQSVSARLTDARVPRTFMIRTAPGPEKLKTVAS